MTEFNAMVLHEKDGKVEPRFERLDETLLPPGEVLVRVEYSTLNYKDGMILEGIGRLVRKYPHVPGVDFAGTVEESSDPAVKPGDKVVLTGWRVGENTWGGYAEKARVKAGQLVKLPRGIDTRRAMAIGTAGYTSMLAVMALEQHGLKPADGEVLVTGAAGGVGSVAVAILAKLGYRVIASTGRPEQAAYLESLGAAGTIARSELADGPKRALDTERWAGAIDSVGSKTLAAVLSQMKYRASVAACGLAQGNDLPTSVIPFLLRGVKLLGIDSVMSPMPERLEAWSRLARDLPMEILDRMIEPAPLAALPGLAKNILAGQVRGRVVVEVRG
jgi:acrylyl-CoA reductase (NADPH)